MADVKKILVAEDEKPLAEALSAKLKREGFEPHVVNNGKEAFAELESNSFDLAVIDLVMPEMDGFGILEGLKEKGIKLPVIVVSNLAQDEDRKKAEALGATRYMVKSNTPLSEVVEEIHTILK